MGCVSLQIIFQHSEDLKRYLSKFESSGTMLFITLLFESVVECLLLGTRYLLVRDNANRECSLKYVMCKMRGTRCV